MRHEIENGTDVSDYISDNLVADCGPNSKEAKKERHNIFEAHSLQNQFERGVKMDELG